MIRPTKQHRKVITIFNRAYVQAYVKLPVRSKVMNSRLYVENVVNPPRIPVTIKSFTVGGERGVNCEITC